MKRIVFINGHCNDLLMTTMYYYLFKIKVPCKYVILLKELAKRDDIELINFVTKDGIYCKPNYIKIPFASLIAKQESKYVLKKNGLGGIKTITDIKQIKDKDIIIPFLMARHGYDRIHELKGHKILHLNQYYIYPIKKLNEVVPFVEGYILEANVFEQGNYIFQAKLPQNYCVKIIPFIVADRFKNTVSFTNRKKKALATGTIGPCLNPDYVKFYGTNLIHKMRQVIYDRRDEVTDLMDVTISPYKEKNIGMKPLPTDSKIVKVFKMLCNHTIYRSAFGQKKYFSFNIVAKYNEYQMAVVPEEICGIPGIGAFEAMACGCALIGVNHHMYKDIGLIPNYHYIGYDGTFEGLSKVIKYYQIHEDELAKIAHNGEMFAKTFFSKENVTSMFVNIINEF